MIRISQAPTYEDADEEIASKIPFIPFVIFGSDKIVTAPDGHRVRGRAYPGVLLRLSESRGRRRPTPLDGRGRTAVSPRCSEATPLSILIGS